MKLGAVSLLVLVLGVAGCSDSGGARSPAALAGSGTPSSSATAPTDPVDYVALGDSYTAAPGVTPVDTASSGCFRSSVNYPALVAEGLPGAVLTDVSCSGADTRAMTHVQPTFGGPVPPQLDALSGDTDLVTVGLGGNDFNVFVTLIGYCASVRSDDPTGAPCAEAQGDGLFSVLDRTGARLERVLRTVGRRAPDARVLVVGYPDLVSSSATCPKLLPLADGDYRFAQRVNDRLNDELRRAARATGAGYVDVAGASKGHDICSADPWVNGGSSAVGAQLYHPFAAEQRAVADLLLDRVLDQVG